MKDFDTNLSFSARCEDEDGEAAVEERWRRTYVSRRSDRFIRSVMSAVHGQGVRPPISIISSLTILCSSHARLNDRKSQEEGEEEGEEA